MDYDWTAMPEASCYQWQYHEESKSRCIRSGSNGFRFRAKEEAIRRQQRRSKKKNRARTLGEGVIRQSGSREAKRKTILKQKAESKPLTETFAHGKLPFVNNH